MVGYHALISVNISRKNSYETRGNFDSWLENCKEKTIAKRAGWTDRSRQRRCDREKLRDRSLGGGDLVINLAGRSICSGRKNSICRVNTLCNGQRDICCRIVCPAAFLDQPFYRAEERKNYHVTLRSSEIQDRTYFPFFPFPSISECMSTRCQLTSISSKQLYLYCDSRVPFHVIEFSARRGIKVDS